jgi:hypothetical protein
VAQGGQPQQREEQEVIQHLKQFIDIGVDLSILAVGMLIGVLTALWVQYGDRKRDRHGIYVCSRVKRAYLWRTARRHREINSTWIDEADNGATEDFGELWTRIRREINRSEALVIYLHPDDFPYKGAYVEVGMALALGVPVRAALVNGLRLTDRTLRPAGSWLLDRNVQCFDTVTDALCLDVQGRSAKAFMETVQQHGD